MKASIDLERIAHVCHEANRALQLTEGDPALSPHFMEAPDWQVESALEGVQMALDGATPEELHNSWWGEKERTGWTFGHIKDAIAKTHPCMIPYRDLPENQRLKDHVFSAIVAAFKAMHEAQR